MKKNIRSQASEVIYGVLIQCLAEHQAGHILSNLEDVYAPTASMTGFLAEKEQNYKSAAQNFDNAWRFTGKTNLAVGYKLAHAYLKLKKYPECIVVSTHILKTHPDYPKIRKEILEKAKTNLRT